MKRVFGVYFTVALIALFVLPSNIRAQAAPKFLRAKSTGRVVFAKGDGVTGAKSARQQGAQFISTATAAIGSGITTFRTTREQKDNIGMTHIKYAQYYRRIPVLGGELAVHTTESNALSSAGISIATDLRTRSVSSLPLAKVLKAAIAAWQTQFKTKTRPQVIGAPRQMILDSGIIKSAAVAKAALVWEVDLTGGSGVTDYKYYVDAVSGAVRLSLAQAERQSAPPIAINRKIYDCSAPQPPGNPMTCPILKDVNGYNFGRLEGETAVGPNPNYLPSESVDVDTLYDNILPSLHQFMWDVFGRKGANNLGGTGDGYYVPYKTYGSGYLDYSPGYACPGASHSRGVLGFCKDFISDDVVAHEYAHSIVLSAHYDPGSGLFVGMTYQGESGALNESHSDVMGELFERMRSGQADWISGQSDVSRCLYDPPSHIERNAPAANPDRFHSPLFYCAGGDNSGVHQNSTVPSKAAYIMTHGGYFNGCTVGAIGADKMAQVLHRAVVQYYAQTETFNGAFYKQIQACNDIIGHEFNILGQQFTITTDDCVQVRRALEAVEMDQPGGCSGLPTSVPSCVDLVGW